MNILEAIEQMRLGKKIIRKCYIGTTVSKCYITSEIIQDNEESIEVIYFNADAIPKGKWIIETTATRNVWNVKQSDLFADDYAVID